MNALNVALKTALSNVSGISSSAPGGVHNTFRPQGCAFPVVVFQRVGARDSQTFSSTGSETLDYQVRVIADADSAGTVGAIVELIHTALERVTLTITGYNHLATLRTARLPNYPEVNASGTYFHDGATYRITVSKT